MGGGDRVGVEVVGVALDQRHVVPVRDEFPGDRAADGAGPGDSYLHFALPARWRVEVLTGRQRRDGHGFGGAAGDGGDVDLVAGLQDGLGLRQDAGSEADQERDPGAGGLFQVGGAVPDPVVVQDDLGDGDGTGRISPFGGLASPASSALSRRSVVHGTVAMVGMPRRS